MDLNQCHDLASGSSETDALTRVSLWRLVGKEKSLFLRDRSNLAVLFVFALCLGAAAWSGVRTAHMAEKTAQAALEADVTAFAERLSLLQEIEAGNAEPSIWSDPRKAHQSVLHTKRPLTPWHPEMRFLSAEDDPLTPTLLEVGMATRHTNPDPVFGNPSQRLEGPFDLIFVVVWLAPLIVILLSYDVLARDRELGQARLLASQNVSLGRIVVARLLVRFVSVASLVALIVLAAAIASPGAGLETLAGSAVWLLGLCLFLGFWFSLSAWINAYSRNASAAGQTLLAAWAGLTLILPLLIGVGAKLVSPGIDRFDTILEYRALSNELNQQRDKVTKTFFSAESMDQSLEALGDEYSQYFVTVFYPMQLAFDDNYRGTGESIERQRVEQLKTLRVGALASPTLAMKLLSDDLAGGAPERRRWFLRNVDRYQDQWRAAFDRKITAVVPMTAEDYLTKPEFSSIPEPFADRWMRVISLLCALGLSAGMVSVFAWRGLRVATP